MITLAKYVQKFSKLKVDRSKGQPAPHKAILLISVIQGISEGEIIQNKIFITPELVARFKDNWNTLNHDIRFKPNFSLPFFHLKSEGFWHLQMIYGRELLLTSSHSIKSFSSLKSAIDYAYLDEPLFEILTNQESRQILLRILMNTYFNGQNIPVNGSGLISDIENQILHESASHYQQEIENADEEEVFVRSNVFKRVIPRVYNDTCCISNTRIICRNIQMIDACHIMPFSLSHDDTVTNGLSLTPSIHRAFDSFLITISPDFKVVVSDQFIESGNHPLKRFNGTQISLPDHEKYHPSTSNLSWHYERFIEQNH